MAVTKIKPIKSTLNKALTYIQNPAKTEDKMLVSSFGCSYETADIEFEFTLSQAIEKGNNLAHHLIQSFDPSDDITPEKAHEIGRELADYTTGGQHEYVLTTHIDKGHIHNHIIFCSVNFITHRKYNSNKKSYYAISNMSDKLCLENGLSITDSKSAGKCYAEYSADKNGVSRKKQLRLLIDSLIPQVNSFTELLNHLKSSGIEIRYGKYISCRLKVYERFIRLKTLGTDYSERSIKERINGTYVSDRGNVSLIIDIKNSVKAQESRGYEHWSKVFNLKQSAKTLTFLEENKIEKYEELTEKITDVVSLCDKTSEELKAVEKRISDMAVVIKNLAVYQKMKKVYDGYKSSKQKDRYREIHEKDLLLYESVIKYLNPRILNTDISRLQKEYEMLKIKKEKLQTEYTKIKKKVKELETVKKNVDHILGYDKKQEHEIEAEK